MQVLEEDFTRSHIRSHMSSFLSAKGPEDGNVSTAKVWKLYQLTLLYTLLFLSLAL